VPPIFALTSFGMSHFWLAVVASVPFGAGLLVAWPFWKKGVKDEIGTIVGAFVVFACALGLVGRDYIEMEGILRRCVALEIGCRFYPGDFTRYAIYAGIAMVQTFVLFMTGLKIEERRRRR